ncbi:MAG TPA: class F sortase [Terriglobales bacterium]|nr:class F sortase [Terriglobales bacterium]
MFRSLADLRPGDEVDVTRQDGEVLAFSVVGSQRIGADADAGSDGLFDTGGPPRLTLIMCAGEWSASQRGTSSGSW